MARIDFLNVLEGDCSIIKHDSGRYTMIDISNGDNEYDKADAVKKEISEAREERRLRTMVPTGKTDYKQKHTPDNPIQYLKDKVKPAEIFRFIITHPDMDHIDGIEGLYSEYFVRNTWDTNNKKELDLDNFGGGYNKEDWVFYKNMRDGKNKDINRRTYLHDNDCLYWNQDDIKILCPSKELLKKAIEKDDYNDSSYAILFTPPKKGGGKWKIIFGGDTHDESWKHIINEYSDDVAKVDVLFAPHHGRDSSRDFSFLDTLEPRVTIFGNASSKHLAYDSYPNLKITNNQAGYIVLDIQEDDITFYVKNFEFARDYKSKKGWTAPVKNANFDAYGLYKINAL